MDIGHTFKRETYWLGGIRHGQKYATKTLRPPLKLHRKQRRIVQFFEIAHIRHLVRGKCASGDSFGLEDNASKYALEIPGEEIHTRVSKPSYSLMHQAGYQMLIHPLRKSQYGNVALTSKEFHFNPIHP
jgi:hypothetical protein